MRLGVIGCGGMGQVDLTDFLANAEVDCPVLCDLDDERLAKGIEICEKAGRPKPDTVKDFRRVLDRKDVDAVLVAGEDGDGLWIVSPPQALRSPVWCCHPPA